MANVLICPKCGQELNDNSRYCSYCGHCLSFKDNQIDNRNNANNTNVYAIIGFVLSLAGDLLITIGGLVLSAIGLKKANREGYESRGLGASWRDNRPNQIISNYYFYNFVYWIIF